MSSAVAAKPVPVAPETDKSRGYELIMEKDGFKVYVTARYENSETVYIWVDPPKNWEQLRGLTVREDGSYDYCATGNDHEAWRKASVKTRSQSTKMLKEAAEKLFGAPMEIVPRSQKAYEAYKKQLGTRRLKLEKNGKGKYAPNAGAWITPISY